MSPYQIIHNQVLVPGSYQTFLDLLTRDKDLVYFLLHSSVSLVLCPADTSLNKCVRYNVLHVMYVMYVMKQKMMLMYQKQVQ